MRASLLSVLLFTLLIASCEVYPQDDYEEFYIVESYLVANRQLPHVRLSTTAPADAYYDFENEAIGSANVEVRLLSGGQNSAVEQSFSYTLLEPGIYYPDGRHKVLPARVYELNITFPDSDDRISAFTVVPDSFQIQGGVRDTIIYQSSEQLEITLSPSSYPGRQNIFIFNALSMNPTVENLTPLYFDFYDDEDDEEEKEDLLETFQNNSSGIINEGNFDLNPDGSLTVDYPWVGFAYYGDNLLVSNTIDDNIYDFRRSQQVQLGGSTLSPGEIQNAIYHVEGGIGVFGAIASDTIRTFIKRNPDLEF